MGACESSNEKTSHKMQSTQFPIKPQKNEYYKIMDFEYEDKSSINSFNENNSTKSNIEEIPQEKPELTKYEESSSLQKLRNSLANQSCASSRKTDEEIIVQGKINLECQNKDEDFDNTSFKELVQKQGGIVIVNKDFDEMSNATSNKEKISEMHYSLKSNKKINVIKLNNKNNNTVHMQNNFQNVRNNKGVRVRKLAKIDEFR